MTKKLHWKLGAYLETHGITAYALGKAIGEGISPNLSYDWAKATEPPQRLYTATFGRVLSALEELTGKAVSVSDLLEYEDAGGGVFQGRKKK